MHCLSCDKLLSDYESTRKHAVTGEYLDLCNYCLRSVINIQPIPFTGNANLSSTVNEDQDDERAS